MTHRIATVAALAACLAWGAARADDAKPVEEQVVDTMNALFGPQTTGQRANHAKGLVVEGSFAAAPGAAALSKAPHLQPGVTVPVIARFSNATGVPAMPDGDPNANPHGLAVRFTLPDGSSTDIVVNSLHTFPVSTIEDFAALLDAVRRSPAGTAHPSPVEQFAAAHPTVGAAMSSIATPASFAQEEYFGVNAFNFINAKGETHAIRYHIVPTAGVLHLSVDEAAHKSPDFLLDDARARLDRGPIVFRMLAQVAEAGDQTKDPAQAWPSDRREVDLGTLTLTKVTADQEAAGRALLFLPTSLADGIETTDDPMPAARSASYAVSFSRRQ